MSDNPTQGHHAPGAATAVEDEPISVPRSVLKMLVVSGEGSLHALDVIGKPNLRFLPEVTAVRRAVEAAKALLDGGGESAPGRRHRMSVKVHDLDDGQWRPARLTFERYGGGKLSHEAAWEAAKVYMRDLTPREMAERLVDWDEFAATLIAEHADADDGPDGFEPTTLSEVGRTIALWRDASPLRQVICVVGGGVLAGCAFVGAVQLWQAVRLFFAAWWGA